MEEASVKVPSALFKHVEAEIVRIVGIAVADLDIQKIFLDGDQQYFVPPVTVKIVKCISQVAVAK